MSKRCVQVLLAAALTVLGCEILAAQTWKQVGPPGGDVQSLAPTPGDFRTVFLGTYDGHVFGSRDAGERWELLGRIGSTGDNVVAALVVEARDPRVLYAATWTLRSSSGGVYRSGDAGHTWKLIGLAGEAVRALAQAPSNPDVLVAGTLGGVYRSRDAGKRWELISPAGHKDLRNFDSVAIDPRDADVIYAGTYHLAWKTTDGGRQWSPIHKGMIDDSNVMSLSVSRHNPDHIFASACSGIYQSADGAATWSKFRGIPPSARRTHGLRQDPQRPEVLYAATTEGLWKTANAGASWTRMTPASWVIMTLLIDPKDSNHLVLATERLGVQVSNDGGKTFRASNNGFYHQQIMDLAVDRGNPNRALVLRTDGVDPVLATADGGRTWRVLGMGQKPGQLRRVFASPDGWWAAAAAGGLLRYDESKGAWAKAGALAVTTPAPAAAVAAAGKTPRGKHAAKATPKAAPARRQSRPLTAVVHEMAFAREQWFACTEAGLLASRDHGATWATVVPGQAHSVGVSVDGNHVWALTSRSVIHSRDGGKTWNTQSLPVETSGARVYVADETTGLVTSRRGLYISRDAGARWEQARLPELQLRDFARIGSVFVVAGRDRLYISDDRGKAWRPMGHSLAQGHFPALGAGADQSTLLAASASEGVYMLKIDGVARSADSRNPSSTSSSRAPDPNQ